MEPSSAGFLVQYWTGFIVLANGVWFSPKSSTLRNEFQNQICPGDIVEAVQTFTERKGVWKVIGACM